MNRFEMLNDICSPSLVIPDIACQSISWYSKQNIWSGETVSLHERMLTFYYNDVSPCYLSKWEGYEAVD